MSTNTPEVQPGVGDPSVAPPKGNGKKALLADSTGLTPVNEGNGATVPPDNVTPLSATRAAKPRINEEEQAALDSFEQLADDAILDDDEGNAPGDADEIVRPTVVKKLPPFSIFAASKVTFDLWGTTDRQGMDDLVFVTTKSFAPNFEDDVDLKRIRFFETVTTDGVIRLVWCPVPEKGSRMSNDWITTKLEALEHAQSQWTTMRTRLKLNKFSHRASRGQNEKYGEPKFSDRTPQQWVIELKKLGLLVDSKNHEFYRKATDSE